MMALATATISSSLILPFKANDQRIKEISCEQIRNNVKENLTNSLIPVCLDLILFI
jgi:hypothetical protein